MTTKQLCYGCFEEISEKICPHCGYCAEQEERPAQALPSGTILDGRYLVGRVLGMGGFGITYLSYDLTLTQKVAIKEYFPATAATRDRSGYLMQVVSMNQKQSYMMGLEKFLEEARILAKVSDNQSIVKVLTFFRENDTAYFVMDYIEGESLKSYLKNRGGRISLTETLHILLPLMDALAKVHDHNLLHRDISTDNIYVTKNGSSKLLDFGAARFALGEEKSLSIILKHGYAPEEQYRQRGNQGPWTDLYAMAATMYNCLTGILPPDALERLHEDLIIPPSDLGINLPVEAEAALMKALAVHARDRFSDIPSFKTALLAADARASGANAYPSVSAGSKTEALKPAFAQATEALQPGEGGNDNFDLEVIIEKVTRFISQRKNLTILSAVALVLVITVIVVVMIRSGSSAGGSNTGGGGGGNKGPLSTVSLPSEVKTTIARTEPSKTTIQTAQPTGVTDKPAVKVDPSLYALFKSERMGVEMMLPKSIRAESNRDYFILGNERRPAVDVWLRVYGGGQSYYSIEDAYENPMPYLRQVIAWDLRDLDKEFNVGKAEKIKINGVDALKLVAVSHSGYSETYTIYYIRNPYGDGLFFATFITNAENGSLLDENSIDYMINSFKIVQKNSCGFVTVERPAFKIRYQYDSERVLTATGTDAGRSSDPKGDFFEGVTLNKDARKGGVYFGDWTLDRELWFAPETQKQTLTAQGGQIIEFGERQKLVNEGRSYEKQIVKVKWADIPDNTNRAFIMTEIGNKKFYFISDYDEANEKEVQRAFSLFIKSLSFMKP